MKARITFDTLAYANRLKAAGLASKIAETQAEANAEMLASLMEGVLVTKQDLIGFATKEDLLELATKQDLNHLEAKMDARFEHFETKMDARFEHMEAKMDARFEHFEAKFEHMDAKMETRFEQVDAKFEHYATGEALARLESKLDKLGPELTLQLTLRLGGLVLGCLAGITAVFSFLHGIP